MLARAVFILSVLVGPLIWAHPVSYKDAVGLMSYNTPQTNEILLTYSFTTHFAMAATYLRDSKSEFYIPRLDLLLKRWNNDDSQGNIYFSAGAGLEKFSSKNYNVSLAEVVADWESRKYYMSLSHLYLKRGNQDNGSLVQTDYNDSKFKIGMAPFLADYNDLNIWLILQAEKYLDQSQIEMTQFLRFNIKNTLWEVGARFDGGWAFNYMIHF